MRGSEASGPGALFDAPSTLTTSVIGNPPTSPTGGFTPLPPPPFQAASYPNGNPDGLAQAALSPHLKRADPGDVVVHVSGNAGSTGKGILIGILSAFGSAGVAVVVLAVFFFFKYTQRGRIILDRIGRPGEYDDEQAFAREEAEALEVMDELSRAEYLRAKGAFIFFIL